MAQDLIKKNEVVGVPANPVIVANLASLPGGVEVFMGGIMGGGDYKYPGGEMNSQTMGKTPKIVKAGHLVYQYDGVWYADGVDEGVFLSSFETFGPASAIGVITEDAPVYLNDDNEPVAICSVMLMGVVDAKQMPAQMDKSSLYSNNVNVNVRDEYGEIRDPHDACHIVFINRPAF